MKQAKPFLISAITTTVIMTTISFFIEDSFQAKSTLVAGIIAGITIATIPIYDINKWSLSKRSLLHFLMMLVTVFPLLLISGWFSPLVSMGVFIAFGIVGWTIGYIVSKLQTSSKKLS